MVNKILKNANSSSGMIAFMSFSGILSNVLAMVSGLVVAKWLLPKELGEFNFFSVITSYVILSQMGIPSGLLRELPYLVGKGKIEEAKLRAAVTQYWELILSISCLSISVLFSFLYIYQHDYKTAAGVFVIGVTTFQILYGTRYLKELYRSNSDFNKISVIELITALTSFVSIFFVWKFGFYGLCIRAILAALMDLFFAWKWRPILVKPKWDKPIFIELFKVGFPQFWISNVYSLWPVLQRTIVFSLGGFNALGLFSLVMVVDSTMSIFANNISNVFFPKMAIKWGEFHSFKKIIFLPLKPVLGVFILNLIIAIVGCFIVPTIIQNFLPNYSGAINAILIMLFVGSVKVFGVFSNSYMILKRNFDRLVSYSIGISIWALCILYFYNIDGFSLAMFPKALLFGHLTIFFVDLFFYKKYLKIYI